MKVTTIADTRPNAISTSLTYLGWACFCILVSLLWLPEIKMLLSTWHGDVTMSHGPVIPVIATALLWIRRKEIHRSQTSAVPGAICLVLCSLFYIAGVWADVAFVRLLSLIGILISTFFFIGGWKALQTTIGALGLLVFMIPLPMTVVEHLSFPLQITSSSYACLLGGLLGVPVVRDGVYLMVVPNPAAKPIYSMMVAQHCSGLTSLTVLLMLAYIIAYYTPLKWGWRAMMVAIVLPLTLFTNTIRLTVILLAGNYHSPAMAGWIHDHETPVLISLCSFTLMGVRHALLTWAQRETAKEGDTHVAVPASVSEHDTVIGSAG